MDTTFDEFISLDQEILIILVPLLDYIPKRQKHILRDRRLENAMRNGQRIIIDMGLTGGMTKKVCFDDITLTLFQKLFMVLINSGSIQAVQSNRQTLWFQLHSRRTLAYLFYEI